MTSRAISLSKTITWRVIATITTILITWIYSGELVLGLAVGGTGAVVKFVLYYVHERIWIRMGA